MRKALLMPAYLSCLFFALFFSACHRVELQDISSLPINYQFINLKSAVSRREGMESQLKNAQVEYKIIDAVYGKDLSEEELEGLVEKGVFDKKTKDNKILKPGEIGVYLSNITKALPNAINNNDALTVTFEDDVIIPTDLETQFRQALKSVPADWDILYLGCYQNYFATFDGRIIGPYMPLKLQTAKEYKYPLCATGEAYRIQGTPWIQLDGGCIAGLYAYVVRKKSAEKIQAMLVPMRKAIDRRLTDLIGRGSLQAYCLNPELIRVNTTIPSTIR